MRFRSKVSGLRRRWLVTGEVQDSKPCPPPSLVPDLSAWLTDGNHDPVVTLWLHVELGENISSVDGPLESVDM